MQIATANIQRTWTVVSDDEYQHQNIMPNNDLKEHVEDFCWCEPRVEMENGWVIFVHNSLDGREFYETHIQNQSLN